MFHFFIFVAFLSMTHTAVHSRYTHHPRTNGTVAPIKAPTVDEAWEECHLQGYLVHSLFYCYKLHTDVKTFDDAESTCVREGGHLVVVDDAKEAEVITSSGFLSKRTPNIYVGLKARDDMADFRSVLGESMDHLYHRFKNGDPKSTKTHKCVVMRQDGRLDNVSCNISRAFLCEKHYLKA